MNLTEPEVPEEDRTDSQSALDFMYWLIMFVEITYAKNVIIPPHNGDEEDGESMLQAVSYCSDQVGLRFVTTNYELFRKRCLENPIPQETALRKRGAVMFFGKSLVVSMGDRKRVIEFYDGDFTCRYLTSNELADDYWECALIPEMIYL